MTTLDYQTTPRVPQKPQVLGDGIYLTPKTIKDFNCQSLSDVVHMVKKAILQTYGIETVPHQSDQVIRFIWGDSKTRQTHGEFCLTVSPTYELTLSNRPYIMPPPHAKTVSLDETSRLMSLANNLTLLIRGQRV